jgi:hypothetical protein
VTGVDGGVFNHWRTTAMHKQFIRGGLALLALGGSLTANATATVFTGTTADTLIQNVATADYSVNNQPQAQESSDPLTAQFRVDERLDVVVVAQGAVTTVESEETGQLVFFDLRNDGNGNEAFALILDNDVGGQFNPQVQSVYLDDGEGGTSTDTFSIADDTLLTPTLGVYTTIELAPGETRRVFVFSDMEAGVDGDEGPLNLLAESVTARNNGTVGAGNSPGDVAGAGDGANGIDAILGLTLGDSDDTAIYQINAVDVDISKVIDSVTDPFGNTFDPQGGGADPNYVTGSLVTYLITVEVTGTGTAQQLTIRDVIPPLGGDGSGVLYVIDSVVAAGNNQTDEDDSGGNNIAKVIYTDLGAAPTGAGEKTAANVDGGVTVEVSLGDVAAGAGATAISLVVEVQ